MRKQCEEPAMSPSEFLVFFFPIFYVIKKLVNFLLLNNALFSYHQNIKTSVHATVMNSSAHSKLINSNNREA